MTKLFFVALKLTICGAISGVSGTEDGIAGRRRDGCGMDG
jgi:hypothetical protein